MMGKADVRETITETNVSLQGSVRNLWKSERSIRENRSTGDLLEKISGALTEGERRGAPP